MMIRTCVLCCLLSYPVMVKSSLPSFPSYSDMDTLMSRLLATNSYNRKVRPIVNQNDPVVIDISLHISSINIVDEVGENMITSGYLEVCWKDELLKWNPSRYKGIELVFIPQNEIWRPDIVLKNGFRKIEEMGQSFYNVKVESTGNLKWEPYEVFRSQCSIDIRLFPFDEQTCHITFITWSFDVHQIEIQKSSHGIQFYEYEENSVWSIISTDHVIVKGTKDSQITFTLRLRRKPLYFIINTIVPTVFLGVLNILVFVIPADSGEKMSYAVTVFLAFSVFLTIYSSQIPTSSEYISILGIYLFGQLTFGILALVITSIQLRFHYKCEKDEIPRFLRKTVVLQGKLRCVKKRVLSNRAITPTNIVEPLSVERNENVHTEELYCWKDVSSAFDFFGFCSLVLMNFLFTSILYLYVGEQ